jgi:hypothetical protein
VTLRTAGRAVGGLFLAAFLLYGGGSFLVDSTAGGATPVPENTDSLGLLLGGATLLLLNSAAVVTIGAIAFQVLRHRHRRTGGVYLATRAAEAALLALAPLGMVTLALLGRDRAESSDAGGLGAGLARALVENGASQYSLAMAALGIGSVLFCRVLLRSGLVPRFLAAWGIVGYAIFALGSVLDLAGLGVGLVMAVPGGLFEVAAGSYLLVKGFRPWPRSSRESREERSPGGGPTRSRTAPAPGADVTPIRVG